MHSERDLTRDYHRGYYKRRQIANLTTQQLPYFLIMAECACFFFMQETEIEVVAGSPSPLSLFMNC